MTDEANNVPKESALVEVSPETAKLVNEQMPDATEQVKKETMALFEAIKKRAQVEIQGASQFTTDAYLKAVGQAREAIEKDKVLDPDRIAYTVKLMEMDARQNWEAIEKEIKDLGDRLSQMATDAWNSIVNPSKKQ
ncbi:hypothetical protein [Oxynema aestuarii]|jgi:phage terminase small subunit|uniref:Uncharacterized protein n=1 Tax=Oxynema aestuarii AP17 TaxID=2064643 RepID=A0A6H1U0Q0_9CYAN|nr:hypothetical protein [Oxynema aestuarii]QIZ72414.1 hypothetical protein HCG48_19005 [Oxynema aestuarii AP17]RMH77751.1 MAG: hypothetical protein D6680_04300 [Cyanobacteria bacterium J007]